MKRQRKKKFRKGSIPYVYDKEYHKYINRIKYNEKVGIYFTRRNPVKNPTRRSIEIITSLTTKEMKRQKKGIVVDFQTGESFNLNKISDKRLKQIIKSNRSYNKQIKVVDEVDLIIRNFESTVQLFIPPLQSRLYDFIDEMIPTGSYRERWCFAKTLKENPDYVPVPTDSNENTVNYKIGYLERIMNKNLSEFREVI